MGHCTGAGKTVWTSGIKKTLSMGLTGRSYVLPADQREALEVSRLPDVRADRDSWCAVYTRHQHEKTVSEMLEAKGFEVFLPLYESSRRWKDRRKLLSLPLFPCYVFLRGAMERRLPVLTTPGVHMIISRGERVATVPNEEIDAIRRTVQGQFRVEPHPFLQCGERVRVIRGSLEGVEGVLTRKKNLYRLVLSVEMLAQSVAVEIDALDVVPVAKRERTPPLPIGGLPYSEAQQSSFLAGD